MSMTSVLRDVGLAVAMSFLAVACSTATTAVPTQAAPPGTVAIQAQVHNGSRNPQNVAVAVPAGPIRGRAQPALLAAGTTSIVTFFVPIDGEWWIALDERDNRGIPKRSFEACFADGRAVAIDVTDRSYGADCIDSL
jgi:hypothetical protein